MVEANFAHGLHLTPGYVYFSESIFSVSTNRVGRVDRTSKEVTAFSTTEGAAPNIYSFDDDTVYWTTWDPKQVRAAVLSVPETKTVATAQNATFALAVAPGSATVLALSTSGEVYELPSQAPPTMIPSTRALNSMGTVTSAVVLGDAAGRTVFWTDQGMTSNGGVYSAPVDSNDSPLQLISDANNAWGLIVTDEYIVYGRRGVGGGNGLSELIRTSRAGGAPLALATLRTEIRGLALDENGDIYFAEFLPRGSIWKVPLDGSRAPVKVVEDQSSPLYVRVTESEIYWTNYAPGVEGGGVYRVKK